MGALDMRLANCAGKHHGFIQVAISVATTISNTQWLVIFRQGNYGCLLFSVCFHMLDAFNGSRVPGSFSGFIEVAFGRANPDPVLLLR